MKLPLPLFALALLLPGCGSTPEVPDPDMLVGLEAPIVRQRAVSHLSSYGYSMVQSYGNGVSLMVTNDRRTVPPRGIRLYITAVEDAERPTTAIAVEGEAPGGTGRPRTPEQEDLDGTRRTVQLLREHFGRYLIVD